MDMEEGVINSMLKVSREQSHLDFSAYAPLCMDVGVLHHESYTGRHWGI